MFTPRQSKFQKQQKGKSIKKVSICSNNSFFSFGSFSLKSMSFGRLTSKELEAMYNSINKIIKKSGRVTICTFAHIPISKKPIEVRMGKGKGSVAFWASKVRAGTVLCSVECSNKTLAVNALRAAQLRLSIKTKIIC